MRRELPADFKRDMERRSRMASRAMRNIEQALHLLEQFDGQTGYETADKHVAAAERELREALMSMLTPGTPQWQQARGY